MASLTKYQIKRLIELVKEDCKMEYDEVVSNSKNPSYGTQRFIENKFASAGRVFGMSVMVSNLSIIDCISREQGDSLKEIIDRFRNDIYDVDYSREGEKSV